MGGHFGRKMKMFLKAMFRMHSYLILIFHDYIFLLFCYSSFFLPIFSVISSLPPSLAPCLSPSTIHLSFPPPFSSFSLSFFIYFPPLGMELRALFKLSLHFLPDPHLIVSKSYTNIKITNFDIFSNQYYLKNK